MRASHFASVRRWLLGAGLAAATTLAIAQAAPAASAPGAAAPAAAAAMPAPRPEDTNAERARSQPLNNAPFWRNVQQSGSQPGISNLPGAEKGVLIQPFVKYPGTLYLTAGEAWRQVRNKLIIPYGGAVLFVTLLAIALFHFTKGGVRFEGPATGRKIERFTYFERAAHWSNALAFVLLAVSGLVMVFGKALLLPILGGTLFGWLAYALKNIHNFAGPLFAVSLLVMIFTFVRDNLPARGDLDWLLKGGGLFSGKHVPSHRFNAGEKLIFWAGVFGLGLVVVGSGLWLDKLIPGLSYLRPEMQVAHMIHASAALLMVALFLGHIYMGTLGMEGALDAMKTGQVDEAWARQHHELWYDDIKAGKIPAQRSDAAADGPPALA
ncbi:formate dehydrogenase subunit gamma [Rivibacter subsaxonicus]|uniref:Formate dehydrogenase gamma subunit n=1 Tax=Rivibacter subsaxonicus TaxID=457575 RepID=A0A4Q7VMS6_9BURK|nr:formate dehydrogenase subunit gamma [Rivibacter subsaxonicus]RZT97636.1 formate dehydrogenase gamma subunit [Rivibacter subsaxonicus]